MEVGKYIDLHADTTSDYNVRMSVNTDGVVQLISHATSSGYGILDGIIRERVPRIDSDGGSLDDYTQSGTYYFNSGSSPTNIPAGVNGWLKVIRLGENTVKQIWYRYGSEGNHYQTFVRTKFSATQSWTDWVRYATTLDLDNKADISHNHDDRYYTEDEIDLIIADKITSTWYTVSIGVLTSGSTVTKVISVLKDGYYPIGIIAHNNDGTNASGINIYELMTDVSANTATVSVRNFSNTNTDNTTLVKIRVLYIKK